MQVQEQRMRVLDEEEPKGETRQIFYTSVVLFVIFAFLVTDRLGPDSVMAMALALCMVAGIIAIKERLQGFSNEGVLTVMVSDAQVSCHSLLLRGPVNDRFSSWMKSTNFFRLICPLGIE